MAVAKLYDLARMTVASAPGSGTITLGGADTVNGVLYLTFAQAGIANGDTVSYAILDNGNSEIGYGVYTAAGTSLTRNVTKSTNSNAAINATANARVLIAARAEDLPFQVDTGGASMTLKAAITTAVMNALIDISGANGGQVKFPASQHPSADANTLDDYEEGIFTPTIGGDSVPGTNTYNNQVGLYVKVGQLVYVTGYVALATKDAAMAGTYALLYGLPFQGDPTASLRMAGAATDWGGMNTNFYFMGLELQNNASVSYISKIAAAGALALASVADISASSYFGFSCCYRAGA